MLSIDRVKELQVSYKAQIASLDACINEAGYYADMTGQVAQYEQDKAALELKLELLEDLITCFV